MKKSLIIVGLVLLMMVPANMFAQDTTDNGVVWNSRYNPGSLMATVGVGFGWGDFNVVGGAETFIYQFRIADVIPLDLSIAGRAGLDLGGFDDLNIGAGGLAVLHFSFAGLENAPTFLDDVDVYGGLGLGFSTVFGGGFGIAGISGANYYLNDNLALNLEWADLGVNWYTYSFGITFKL